MLLRANPGRDALARLTLGTHAGDDARANAVDLTSPRIAAHEVCRSETTRSLNHHRLAGRYPDDPAHLFCRLDYLQERSAGSRDQFTGVEDIEPKTGGARKCVHQCRCLDSA